MARHTSTTSVKLNDALKARLQKLAEARRRSPHWLMCEAIEQYVEREEKREAEAASDAKAEEAYAWLAQLEAKRTTNQVPPMKSGRWR